MQLPCHGPIPVIAPPTRWERPPPNLLRNPSATEESVGRVQPAGPPSAAGGLRCAAPALRTARRGWRNGRGEFRPAPPDVDGSRSAGAIEALGPAMYHVHAKDTRLEAEPLARDGRIQIRPAEDVAQRTWNYVILGRGHDLGGGGASARRWPPSATTTCRRSSTRIRRHSRRSRGFGDRSRYCARRSNRTEVRPLRYFGGDTRPSPTARASESTTSQCSTILPSSIR